MESGLVGGRAVVRAPLTGILVFREPALSPILCEKYIPRPSLVLATAHESSIFDV